MHMKRAKKLKHNKDKDGKDTNLTTELDEEAESHKYLLSVSGTTPQDPSFYH